jgi:hypothetical protein
MEYRSLPPDSDSLPDTGINDRKCKIMFALDADVNDPDVANLLIEVLRNPREFDLARVEAIKVVGLYIEPTHPRYHEFRDELIRIAKDSTEAGMLRDWAERYTSPPYA